MGKKQVAELMLQLTNESAPQSHRSQQLLDILHGLHNGEENYQPYVDEVFRRLQNSGCDEQAAKRAKILKEILEQVQLAPLRPATFIQMSNIGGAESAHALVTMENGELAYVVAHDQEAARQLKLGDRVMLDAQSKILVHPALNGLYCGGEARLERRIDDRHVEVMTHQDEKVVLLCGPELMADIDSGKVNPGASIVLGAGGRLGVLALPPAGHTHFRFLDRGAVPDVVVERDIGSPSPAINRIALQVREEMLRPELRRRFRLRRCSTWLFAGVSGSGKTLTSQAIHRIIYEIMAEVTGTPINDLPHRVFRWRMSQVLSMWLGESDKNTDRIFDEIETIATQTYTNKDGKQFTLPVLVIMEEAEGIGRSRGGDNEAVYDRILTTLLQRLDPNRHSLANNLIVFIATTNEPHLVDPAFLRRIGGSIEMFGRLDQKGFTEVLLKHIDGLPAQNGGGHSQKKLWSQIVSDLNDWLFLPGSDKGVVELTYQNHINPVVKYHRDFLTGALIDRAVQQAATEAWEASLGGDPESGINREGLLRALVRQVQSVADQLQPHNAGRYLDLPEGVRVTGIKRITHHS